MVIVQVHIMDEKKSVERLARDSSPSIQEVGESQWSLSAKRKAAASSPHQTSPKRTKDSREDLMEGDQKPAKPRSAHPEDTSILRQEQMYRHPVKGVRSRAHGRASIETMEANTQEEAATSAVGPTQAATTPDLNRTNPVPGSSRNYAPYYEAALRLPDRSGRDDRLNEGIVEAEEGGEEDVPSSSDDVSQFSSIALHGEATVSSSKLPGHSGIQKASTPGDSAGPTSLSGRRFGVGTSMSNTLASSLPPTRHPTAVRLPPGDSSFYAATSGMHQGLGTVSFEGYFLRRYEFECQSLRVNPQLPPLSFSNVGLGPAVRYPQTQFVEHLLGAEGRRSPYVGGNPTSGVDSLSMIGRGAIPHRHLFETSSSSRGATRQHPVQASAAPLSSASSAVLSQMFRPHSDAVNRSISSLLMTDRPARTGAERHVEGNYQDNLPANQATASSSAAPAQPPGLLAADATDGLLARGRSLTQLDLQRQHAARALQYHDNPVQMGTQSLLASPPAGLGAPVGHRPLRYPALQVASYYGLGLGRDNTIPHVPPFFMEARAVAREAPPIQDPRFLLAAQPIERADSAASVARWPVDRQWDPLTGGQMTTARHSSGQIRSRAPSRLPPCDEGPLRSCSQRDVFPLTGDEDENWLSEYLCYVRSDLIEVFRASETFRRSHGNSSSVVPRQVGFRCRFCAHLPQSERTASRSYSFPTTAGRIYQSAYMMIHDHFPHCTAIPDHVRTRFLTLKEEAVQGAAKSRNYWADSARDLGIVETPAGLMMAQDVDTQDHGPSDLRGGMDNDDGPPGILYPSYALSLAYMGRSSSAEGPVAGPAWGSPEPLLASDDQSFTSEFLFALLSHASRVVLTETERSGQRRSLQLGAPGFSCRYCAANSRSGGNCRFFPVRRRLLPEKLIQLHDHLRRCSLCPPDARAALSSLRAKEGADPLDTGMNRLFLDRLWRRIQGGTTAEASPH